MDSHLAGGGLPRSSDLSSLPAPLLLRRSRLHPSIDYSLRCSALREASTWTSGRLQEHLSPNPCRLPCRWQRSLARHWRFHSAAAVLEERLTCTSSTRIRSPSARRVLVRFIA